MDMNDFFNRLQEFPGKLEEIKIGIDCPYVCVNKENLYPFLQFLKNSPTLRFNMIVDVTAVDYLNRIPRFDIVYHIFSIDNNVRIRVKSQVEENGSVESVTSLWKGAEWLEREVYDMFGINFLNHPDLRRILMTEDYKYYPLRKDFPLQGIEEK